MANGVRKLSVSQENSGLISDDYRKEQQILHEKGGYGIASIQFAPMVSEVVNRMGVHHLLDYGCGQCNLAKNLKVKQKLTYQAYDPGIEQFSTPPVPAEMVACIDVLEHIEPEHLDAVLDDLKRLSLGVILATVALVPAEKTLSDGRNAHLIIKPMEWWLPKFWDRWEIQSYMLTDAPHRGFVVIGFSKGSIERENGSLA
jgi:hypothetical protein